MKKIIIVRDSIVFLDEVDFHEGDRLLACAVDNLFHNPQRSFDRGVSVMIQAYKEIGPADYITVIGDCGVAAVITSSQDFFACEVEEKFNAAGIDATITAIAATTDKFWSKEITTPIETDAGVKFHEMELKTCKIAAGKTRRYYFDIFNYDRGVAVYKVTPRGN